MGFLSGFSKVGFVENYGHSVYLHYPIVSSLFQVVLSAAGRCHSKMGNWEAALGSAEFVLSKDPKNPGAILIKAEALFNLCNFEHALMHFYRGQVIVPFFH